MLDSLPLTGSSPIVTFISAGVPLPCKGIHVFSDWDVSPFGGNAVLLTSVRHASRGPYSEQDPPVVTSETEVRGHLRASAGILGLFLFGVPVLYVWPYVLVCAHVCVFLDHSL